MAKDSDREEIKQEMHNDADVLPEELNRLLGGILGTGCAILSAGDDVHKKLKEDLKESLKKQPKESRYTSFDVIDRQGEQEIEVREVSTGKGMSRKAISDALKADANSVENFFKEGDAHYGMEISRRGGSAYVSLGDELKVGVSVDSKNVENTYMQDGKGYNIVIGKDKKFEYIKTDEGSDAPYIEKQGVEYTRDGMKLYDSFSSETVNSENSKGKAKDISKENNTDVYDIKFRKNGDIVIRHTEKDKQETAYYETKREDGEFNFGFSRNIGKDKAKYVIKGDEVKVTKRGKGNEVIVDTYYGELTYEDFGSYKEKDKKKLSPKDKETIEMLKMYNDKER